MPTRVWLMRHAETARPGIFHGAESDVDLSDRGHHQVAAVAPVIAAYRPDGVVSSGMLRARRTAAPFAAACGLPLHIEPALHERRVGSLVGEPVNPDLGIWPDTLRRWVEGDTAYAPPGAESFDDVRGRVLPVWQRLTQQFADRSLLIVAHGIVCRVLLLSLLDGYSVADWTKLGRIHNLAVSELVLAGESWQAVRLGEIPTAVKQ